MRNTRTIILAAGHGTRMVSDKPKVLHEVCGETLVGHVIRANHQAGIDDIAVIVGFQAERVADHLPKDVRHYLQAEQLGTGHAVIQAMDFIKDFDGNVLILMGDAPLIRPETLNNMVTAHEEKGCSATVLTAFLDDPTGYGRMIKSGDDLIRIVEDKDATAEEKEIKEINSGMYCFNARDLADSLSEIRPNNAQGEYYLTDVIEILRNQGKKVSTYASDDPEDLAAVNNKVQLAEVGAIMRKRINHRLMTAGAIMADPNTVYLSADTQVGKDTVIYPGVMTEGKVVIGANCVIGHNVRIVDSVIADGAVLHDVTMVNNAVVTKCRMPIPKF